MLSIRHKTQARTTITEVFKFDGIKAIDKYISDLNVLKNKAAGESLELAEFALTECKKVKNGYKRFENTIKEY